MVVHELLAETQPGTARTGSPPRRRPAKASRAGEASASTARLIRIPVVVHVVHQTDEENISDAQVKSQIDVLNKDFRAKNADRNKMPAVWKGLVIDSIIEFELAKKDPKGKQTTGITRTATTADGFGSDDDVKSKKTGGVDAWPTDRYLNIWVCKLRDGLLGYAQFPGGPAETDGVVILYTAFGTSGTAPAAVQQGPHRHSRGRALPEPAPHLGRHATTAPATTSSPTRPAQQRQLRQAQVPAHHLQQRPATATCS